MNTKRPILLVEDNPDDEALTLRAFSKNRISNPIVVARDGVEALDYLAACEPGRLPSVVLLDVKLPKLDGIEVLRRLRADPRTALLRVVMLTSSKEEQDVARAYSLGANSYIRKPVDFNKFNDAILQLGLYWLVLNEPSPEA